METYGNTELSSGAGTLSFMIKRLQEENIAMTHFLILNLKYDKTLSEGQQSTIRANIFKRINGKKYEANFMNGQMTVDVTWKSFNKTTSMLYYLTSPTDEQFIRQCTKKLLRQIFLDINHTTKSEVISAETWNMSFLVGKNTSFSVQEMENTMTNGNYSNFDAIQYRTPATPARIEEASSSQ